MIVGWGVVGVGRLCKKQDLSFGQVVVFPYLRSLESE